MFDFLKRNKSTEGLFFKTDIHSHIIPGVDDGAHHLEASIYLVKQMRNFGITKMIATPHVTHTTFPNTPETLKEPYESLVTALKKEEVAVDVIHSAEYRMDEFFEENVLAKDDFMLLPHNYILIENSFMQQNLNFEQIIFDLKMKGLHPILAHPERYSYYAQRKEVYHKIHDFEVQFQLNLLSFSGYYGKEIKETAFWLLKQGLVDFVGTDLHRREHIETIKKFIGSSDYKKLVKNATIKNDIVFGNAD